MEANSSFNNVYTGIASDFLRKLRTVLRISGTVLFVYSDNTLIIP